LILFVLGLSGLLFCIAPALKPIPEIASIYQCILSLLSWLTRPSLEGSVLLAFENSRCEHPFENPTIRNQATSVGKAIFSI